MRTTTIRGFAAMSPERHKEIARRGGLRAQQTGKAHRWTKETATAARRKRSDKRVE